MKSKFYILHLLGAAFIFLSSCSSSHQMTRNQTTISSDQVVEYQLARNYFIKNTVTEAVPSKISSQEEFDTYFGIARVMGDDGEATPIDFSSEYVIVADFEDTNKRVEMVPIGLHQEDQNLIFQFKVTEGAVSSAITRPFLLIVVSQENQGEVVLQRL